MAKWAENSRSRILQAHHGNSWRMRRSFSPLMALALRMNGDDGL